MDDSQRFGLMLSKTRYEAKISQETIATELGVSRKTIVNWEKGLSSPDVWQLKQWFDIIGSNPLSFIYAYMYPEMESDMDDIEVDKMLKKAVNTLPVKMKRMLLYILQGKHSSSPYSIFNMVLAHLNCSTFSRVNHAMTIFNDYKMHEMINKLTHQNEIQPDMTDLGHAISIGYNSVVKDEDKHTT